MMESAFGVEHGEISKGRNGSSLAGLGQAVADKGLGMKMKVLGAKGPVHEGKFAAASAVQATGRAINRNPGKIAAAGGATAGYQAGKRKTN